MSISTHLLSTNPFNYMISHAPRAFCGRQKELKTICDYLLGMTPNCCAIIGESYSGKTSLLRYLTHPEGASAREDLGVKHLTFVYLDASPYIALTERDQPSVQFWNDLHSALQAKLDQKNPSKSPPAKVGGQKQADIAYEIKHKVEKLVKEHASPIIFALDNFQGIASLPLRDSAWLRSIAINDSNCAFVISSRYLLHLLYHPENRDNPSPLWNLFSGYITLGLFNQQEARELIFQKENLERFWRKEDIEFIERTAGRHPALLRLTCALLYEQHQQREVLGPDEYDSLEARIYRDASPICNQIWNGLADPELMGIARDPEYRREPAKLSRPQKTLMDIANTGESSEDIQLLYDLEARGVIERIEDQWAVFSDIMRQFVLRQEQVRQMISYNFTATETLSRNLSRTQSRTGNSSSTQAMTQPAFTYIEGKVYGFLRSHIEEVCDKEEIKQAIWKGKLPSDSTLQKIIERIRRKIEPEPDNPRYLIAVRGQGYILRNNQAD